MQFVEKLSYQKTKNNKDPLSHLPDPLPVQM